MVNTISGLVTRMLNTIGEMLKLKDVTTEGGSHHTLAVVSSSHQEREAQSGYRSRLERLAKRKRELEDSKKPNVGAITEDNAPKLEFYQPRSRHHELIATDDSIISRLLRPEDEGQRASTIQRAQTGRKPWETLVIGADLGENLSKIEYKNRRILQQQFIIRWSEQNEPDGLKFRKEVLNALLEDKAKLEEDQESYLTEDQLHERTAVIKRLEILKQALERTEFEEQSRNIRTAIQAYEKGEIGCSHEFTLIYAGRIVDTCPSYDSFTSIRHERLDSLYERMGPGWLWYEPPLARPGDKFLAKKGFWMDRSGSSWQGASAYRLNMRFIVNPNKVHRGGGAVYQSKTAAGKYALRSATFSVMLDTGSSFPMLDKQDFMNLGIDMKRYSCQTVIPMDTVGSQIICPVYELDVGIGSPLEEENDGWHRANRSLGWPYEQGILGGFYPVAMIGSQTEDVKWTDRLSSCFPFKVSYMSSVPTSERIWLGENRKEVLGAQRFPPYQRYGTADIFDPGYPPKFEKRRAGLGTPDGVMFIHRLNKNGLKRHEFVDFDLPDEPGRTEYEERGDNTLRASKTFGPGQNQPRATPKFIVPLKKWQDKY
ncbi:hypothetical protein JX265_012471 [Neoarthrinium moseri]|uniref:Uncharacterized protein n=1 Tax=Neoarthrinium moseri TaxID=1658444 RepID=A0A9P9WAU5_9PEZI|nr:hypothetical protein JX265_012471 [Neoarthrinium moseri]